MSWEPSLIFVTLLFLLGKLTIFLLFIKNNFNLASHENNITTKEVHQIFVKLSFTMIFRRTMRTPVNMILTAMACCDTVVLFSNLIYTTHYSFVAFKHCHPRHWSYAWALFLIAHAHISLVGHSSSVWLSGDFSFIRKLGLHLSLERNNEVVKLLAGTNGSPLPFTQ